MPWKLCGLGDISQRYHYTECRHGIASDGEPPIVTRTYWFQTQAERDSFLLKNHELPTESEFLTNNF